MIGLHLSYAVYNENIVIATYFMNKYTEIQMVKVDRIELSFKSPKDFVLPLHYTQMVEQEGVEPSLLICLVTD